MSDPATFTYEGDAYVRPVGRGVILDDAGVYVDQVIEDLLGHDGPCRVRIDITVWDSADA